MVYEKKKNSLLSLSPLSIESGLSLLLRQYNREIVCVCIHQKRIAPLLFTISFSREMLPLKERERELVKFSFISIQNISSSLVCHTLYRKCIMCVPPKSSLHSFYSHSIISSLSSPSSFSSSLSRIRREVFSSLQFFLHSSYSMSLLLRLNVALHLVILKNQESIVGVY